MSPAQSAFPASVAAFCAELGHDPLLVQGAGGNVSWKEGDTLHVKASGTWLAQAVHDEIFVPVELGPLRAAMASGDYAVAPVVRSEARLKPSIETSLHALLPQRLVVHLHAVEILTHLVRADSQEALQQRLPSAVPWAVVEYRKPGAELTQAVSAALRQTPDARIVLLRNHGVVLGGGDVAEIRNTLDGLISALKTEPPPSAMAAPSAPSPIAGYRAISDAELADLAMDPTLFDRLAADWALYPDHVVFLGARAPIFASWDALRQHLEQHAAAPELIFIRDTGVFVRESFGPAKLAQLRCYYEVVRRQSPAQKLTSLTHEQVAELLNWDAEKYRISLAK